MQPATVQLRLDDGGVVTLRPGELIGRSRAAVLQLNDPRISEVHAYVSLRGGALVLIALRGTLTVDGIGATEVALAVDDRPLTPVTGDLLSVRRDGSILEGFEADALARVWYTGDQWFLDCGDGPQPFGPLLCTLVGGHRLHSAWAPAESWSASATVGRAAYPPVRIVSRWDSAQIQHAGSEVVLLSGLAARLLSELVALGGSARWEVVAGELWRGQDALSSRARWDKALAALRRKLEQGGVRPDLVQTAGGICELVLFPNDRVDVEEA